MGGWLRNSSIYTDFYESDTREGVGIRRFSLISGPVASKWELLTTNRKALEVCAVVVWACRLLVAGEDVGLEYMHLIPTLHCHIEDVSSTQ